MLHIANTYENSHQMAAISSIRKHGLCIAGLAIAEECDYYKQEGKEDRKTFNHYSNVYVKVKLSLYLITMP